MSSNDPYGTTPFNRNERLTAAKLESLRQGNQGNVQIRNPDNFVRRLPGGHILTEKRRRGNTSGSSLFYFEVTDNTNESTYTCDLLDNPIDETVLEEDVTVRALQHDGGTIADGQKMWAIKVSDVYHFVNYSYALGN